jgi:hypothetical protein
MNAVSRNSLVFVTLSVLAGAGQADAVFSTFGVITAPAALAFSNTTDGNLGGSLAVSSSPGSSYNFQDTWNFSLSGNANVQSFVGSINFTDPQGGVTSGISNLQLNLLYSPGSSSQNPLQTWTTGVSFEFPITNVGSQQLFSIIATTPYSAGTYALNVRGTLVGPVSAYSGTLLALNTVVPVPAAAPLFASGLAALAWRSRRRAG